MRIHVTISSLVPTTALAMIMALAGACDDDPDRGRPMSVIDGNEDQNDDSEPADDDSEPADDDDGAEVPPRAVDEPLTEEAVRFYLAKVAPVVAGRSLTYEEFEMIGEMGEDAIDPMIRSWVTEPGFAESIRYLVQEQLQASGERDGVDYELPGNLAAQIAREGLPWSTILTADHCVSATGEAIECDTGAPYAAGVLATRAYLISNKGRFNLSRAKLMLERFACRVYPMEAEVQPPLTKAVMIPMFRADTAEEQVVEEAKGGFGNGLGCHGCHAQFGAHAQLFVRFDENGIWRADATGQQNPYDELGRSFDGLYTSHMFDPFVAAQENSQMFGQEVANLREAAEVITDSELFPQCTVKNLVAHAFDLQAGATEDVAATLVSTVAAELTAESSDPTIAEYVTKVFTNEQVIDAVVASLESE